MGWGFVWLMLVLKIPIVALLWLVWWAVKQAPDPFEEPSDDGGTKRDPHRPRPRTPRPRRGPHGDPAAAPPARVRTTVARGRRVEH